MHKIDEFEAIIALEKRWFHSNSVKLINQSNILPRLRIPVLCKNVIVYNTTFTKH